MPDFRSTCHSSVGKMRSYSELPEEIMVDILSRLPVKTAGRFRCVSKPWRSLLSRPDFIRTHLNRSRNLLPESLALITEGPLYHPYQKNVRQPLYYASLSNARHLFDGITISAKRLKFSSKYGLLSWVHVSCDGLLLVLNTDDEMFVLNPITNEIRKLPESPIALDHDNMLYGFGYDYVSDSYKIVVISVELDESEDEDGYTKMFNGNTEMFTCVFSLKTGAWNKCESSSYNYTSDQCDTGVFVDGCIHWLGWTDDWKPTIVAFDVVQEKFHEIAPPSGCSMTAFITPFLFRNCFSGLVALSGCLCIFNKKKKEIWVMKEYGVQESWTKLTIDDPKAGEMKPICMLGQEKVVLEDGEKLIIYNLAKRIQGEEEEIEEEKEEGEEEIQEEEEEEEIVRDIVVNGIQSDLLGEVSFVESLVSPHVTN